MAKDEREEEQELLASLKARHGKDLAEWMAAITAQGFTDKNQAIDWLRAQGIPFARASWLERIHHNGGKPIYADAPPSSPVADAPKAAPPRRSPEHPPRKSLSASDAAHLEKLLAAAKGYRPLYHLLESEVAAAIPGIAFAPAPAFISLRAPKEFAAVALLATELRLGMALGERPFDAQLQKARLKGVGADITHMVVLIDARQINGDLLDLLRSANAGVNS